MTAWNPRLPSAGAGPAIAGGVFDPGLCAG